MFIVGASTLGQIVAEVATRNGLEVHGFFDDFVTDAAFCGAPLIGPLERVSTFAPVSVHGLFVAIGDNGNRAMLHRRLTGPLVNVIDATAVLEPSATIGHGNLVMPFVYVGTNSRIGSGNILCAGSVLNHDVEMNDYCFVGPNTAIAGFAKVKDESKIGSGSIVCEGVVLEPNSILRPGEVRSR
jgi:sugar O-acyltransferase (sialic acid O-acetyltransferase NeuD family)